MGFADILGFTLIIIVIVKLLITQRNRFATFVHNMENMFRIISASHIREVIGNRFVATGPDF